jgi:hypothetical protein
MESETDIQINNKSKELVELINQISIKVKRIDQSNKEEWIRTL